MEGHIGLSNEKQEEISSGDFIVALSYLKKDQRIAYFVIHVYSNSFDFSPYLQRSNIQPNGRRNFLFILVDELSLKIGQLMFRDNYS